MYWAAGLLLIAASLLAAWLVVQYGLESWPHIAILMVLALVVENFAFRLPVAGSVSLSFALSYAAMLYSGPLAGLLCSVIAAHTLEDVRSRKPAVLGLFNVGQLALSAGTAGLIYVELGGPILARGDTWISSSSLLAVLVAPLVFYVINVSAVGYAASILTGRPFSAVLRQQGFLSYGGSLLVLALLGLLVAQILALASWIGLLVLVLPFMFARRTFRVYAELAEAYTSTVRSLVTAIEAKDPYTRGHSERVAVYARRLAEHLGRPPQEADLLERAALLHDVGKIGISLDTLTSPEQLSAEEIRAIRMHPVLGGELVEEIDFLSDAAPIVRHHHERFDGAGYPDGLVGDAIPLLARVLTVADSYDAMTSDRAYRPRMTQDEAIEEMLRVKGMQLDAAIVEQFTAMLAEPDKEASTA